MKLLRLIGARWRGLFRKEALEQELDDELRFHVAMRTEEFVARGMPPSEAAAAARRQLGNVGLIKDACRDLSGGGALEVLLQDVRFAARMLLKERGFTAVAVIALALGIGANTALFTVTSSVLLRPLPYVEPDQLMSISYRERGSDTVRDSYSHLDFEDLQARNQSFERLGGFRSIGFALTSANADAAHVQGAQITSDILPILRVKPAVGRSFAAADDEVGTRTVLISDELWRTRFGRAANITKTTLTIDAEKFAIIGVMPPDFRFPIQNEPAQVWITFAREKQPFRDGSAAYTTYRAGRNLQLLGRLKPGVTSADASADLTAITIDLAATYPDSNGRQTHAVVTSWLADLTRDVRPALLMLIAAAVCVLCVGCANIANLLLARSTSRQREIALRCALGAGRRRILRQLLTESVMLAAIGGCAGLILALWGTSYMVGVLPADFPRAAEIAPDWRVLAFTGGIALLTSCMFGFAPAWRSSRGDVASVLNDCSRGSTETPKGRRARNILVVAEMILAFVLLAGACGLLRTVWRLQNVPLGFDPADLFTVRVTVPDEDVADARLRVATLFQELLQRLREMDGVESATAVYPPPSMSRSYADFEIIGRTMPRADWPRARMRAVTSDYFRTMRIPLKKGRDFHAAERRDGAPVVIVNETLARSAFGDADPIGQRIRPGYSDSSLLLEREIIGVVGDAQPNRFTPEQRAEAYLPHAQCASGEMTLILRSQVAPEDLFPAVRVLVAEISEQAPLHNPSTMEQNLARAIAQPRLSATLLSAFAAIAVILTAIGVYGVMAYSVVQRRHEIGIRLALGAQKLTVFNLVLREGARLIAWSVAGGAVCTAVALPIFHAFAGGIGGTDIAMVSVPALLLVIIGLIACCLPARRAAGLDPLVALGQR